jgi:hypothetical protein
MSLIALMDREQLTSLTVLGSGKPPVVNISHIAMTRYQKRKICISLWNRKLPCREKVPLDRRYLLPTAASFTCDLHSSRRAARIAMPQSMIDPSKPSARASLFSTPRLRTQVSQVAAILERYSEKFASPETASALCQGLGEDLHTGTSAAEPFCVMRAVGGTDPGHAHVANGQVVIVVAEILWRVQPLALRPHLLGTGTLTKKFPNCVEPIFGEWRRRIPWPRQPQSSLVAQLLTVAPRALGDVEQRSAAALGKG